MKTVMDELRAVLGCEISMMTNSKNSSKISSKISSKATKTTPLEHENMTAIELAGGETLIVHRTLTPLEEQLVGQLAAHLEKRISTQAQDASPEKEAQILLDPEGYKLLTDKQRYPIKLWRIVFKENHEAVDEILASTFGTSKIIAINPQERIVFVAKSPISPADLLGMLESEALTSSKITIGNTITKASELHAGYKQLIDLWHLAQTLKHSEQIITYDAFLLPMLIYRLSEAQQAGQISPDARRNQPVMQHAHDMAGEGIAGIMKHHVKAVGDTELEHTALAFFKNNLNITETAGALFIHRNTLIYRLNKLESITGYDIRKFGDAINYYLSYLVDNIK